MRSFNKLFFGLIFFISICSTTSFADTDKFDGIFFKPAIGKNSYFMLDSTDTLAQSQFYVGAISSYGYRPVELRMSGVRIQGVVDHLFVTDAQAAFGILDWMQLGVDMPLVMINKYQDPLIIPGFGTKNYFDLGDLRVNLKIRALHPLCYTVGLAFVPFLTVPTGNSNHFVGNTGLTGGGKVVFDFKPIKNMLVTANIGYLGGKKVSNSNVNFQHRFLYGAGLGYDFMRGLSVFGEINGENAFEHYMSKREENPIEATVGVKWNVANTGFEVSAGGGYCIICGFRGARGRGILGLSYRLGTEKFRQKEEKEYSTCPVAKAALLNIYELEMKCPRDPKTYDPKKDDSGCPKYYELLGYANLVVECPPLPDQFNPGVHNPECSKVYDLKSLLSEEDRMNVYMLALSEMDIRCPAKVDDFDPMVHDAGCPKYFSLGDAWEMVGQCPAPSKYVKGQHSADCLKVYEFLGSPSDSIWNKFFLAGMGDVDLDRVIDILDKCAADPETYNEFLDKDGCPEYGFVALVKGMILTAHPILFDFNSARLKSADKKAIADVANFVNEKLPDLKRIRVSGHADSIGTPEANIKISHQRSMFVISELKKNGIRSDIIMEPMGYGAERPEFPNVSAQNRAKNRRVVFEAVFK